MYLLNNLTLNVTICAKKMYINPKMFAYCSLSVRLLFSFLISSHRETKMLPHGSFKSCRSVNNFTNFATCGIYC